MCGALLIYEKESLYFINRKWYPELGICLSYCSVAVKRHHKEGNLKRKHLPEGSVIRVGSVVRQAGMHSGSRELTSYPQM